MLVFTMPPVSWNTHRARPPTVTIAATAMAMVSPLPPNLAAGTLAGWAADTFSIMISPPYTR